MTAWWVVRPTGGLPMRSGDHAYAVNYAAHVHGTIEGPMSEEDAIAKLWAYQRALTDGASPMEKH